MPIGIIKRPIWAAGIFFSAELYVPFTFFFFSTIWKEKEER